MCGLEPGVKAVKILNLYTPTDLSAQGLVACKDWYDDYIECTHKSKQALRVKAMFKKRQVDHHLV